MNCSRKQYGARVRCISYAPTLLAVVAIETKQASVSQALHGHYNPLVPDAYVDMGLTTSQVT
jgi:hypothetical protein